MNLHFLRGNVIVALLKLTIDGGHMFIASFVSRALAYEVLFGHD
jgi:hypothetical protein